MVYTKRIYCDACQRMVMGNEQKTGHRRQVTCPRCKKVLRTFNGTAWTYVRSV